MFSIRPYIREHWYIVFEPALRKRWFHRFMQPGFTHCYCMKLSPGGKFWIIVNCYYEHMDVGMRLVDTFPTVRDYAGDDAVIVECRSFLRDNAHESHQLCLMTCVDVVKRCIGLRSYRVWTPYQLYRRLKHGQWKISSKT